MLVELVAVLGLLILLYKFYNPYNYWKKKGYPHLEGTFPVGTWPNRFLSTTTYQGKEIQDVYNKLAPHPFGGYYIFLTSELILRDPELIKYVMVKDFAHFKSRFGKNDTKKDPISQHLFNLEGDLWKKVRVKLTPTFTSGKLKLMYSLFETCAGQMSQLLEESVGKDIDIKDIFARFTTDIIATCAFGLEINSINNPDNQFRKIGQDIFPPYITWTSRINITVRLLAPSFFEFIRNTFGFKLLPEQINNFIINVIKDTIEYREKNNVKRNDFLNMLIEMKNKGSIENDDHKHDDHNKVDIDMDLGMIAAQCFVFFAAGFETSSSVQSYALYELALNQEIQDRARREIDHVLANHKGEASYQALQEMPYLEQIISETVRKYPTIPVLTRKCTADYKLEEFGLEVEKGQGVIIPVYALHHDPKYFPEPEKFDPDRFSEENKSSIVPYTYLPFGEGPRLCIGMRFGMLQTKLGLVTVLSRLRVLPSPTTPIPLKFVGTSLVSTVDGSINLKLEKRNDK